MADENSKLASGGDVPGNNSMWLTSISTRVDESASGSGDVCVFRCPMNL